MNKFKTINLIVFCWALEALNMTASKKKGEEAIDFAVGGQAVIEGVMMRSPNSVTIAVRRPDKTIALREKKYRTIIQRYPWLNMPILRGVINLFEMMIIGTDAINYSANESLEEDEKPKSDSKKKEPGKLAKFLESLMFALSFVIAIALSLSLFKFLPFWGTTFLEGQFPIIADNYVLFNFIDGVLKLSIFILYILLLTLWESFRRIFEYHGAEHKSIFAYEMGLPLTVDNAAKQTRFHPRCGTSFILIVFIISIIFYTFVPKLDSFWQTFGLRVAVLPLIAGFSYEFLKASAKHQEKALMKVFIRPGLWLQKLTTKEPKSDQLEVGLHSLKAALKMEKSCS